MKKIFAMIALILPMTVMAQEEKDTTVVIPQVERTLLIAADLSKYGYTNNDALSLIQAARLSKQAGFVCVDCAKETTARIEMANNGTKNGKISLDPVKLLGDAKKIAANDGVLLALIDDVNTNVRGAVGGEKYASSSVNAGATDVYNISFRGGELAMVIVVGDGDTDLDLYVYDNNGNLIARDADYSDDCVVTFTPRWTGNFRIKIVNRGRVYNSYVLRTN